MTRFTEEGKNPNTGQNQERNEYHDHILLSHKKMETQNKKISHFPVFLVMTFNNKSPNTHSRHLTVILEASSPDHNTASPYHPHQDIPCRLAPCQSNTTQSHTSVRARTLLEPSRRSPRRRKSQRSERNKKLPK